MKPALRLKSPLILGAICILALSAHPALADTFHLFRTQNSTVVQNPDYNDIIHLLSNPQADQKHELVFSNGRHFRIGRFLGSGNTTAIFELINDSGHVLRIPLHSGKITAGFMSGFIQGKKLLAKLDVPSVEISEAYEAEYAKVDRLTEGSETLKDFLMRAANGKASESEIELISRALPELARKTAALEWVGDGHSGNIVYEKTRQELIYFDWNSEHVLYRAESYGKDLNPIALAVTPFLKIAGPHDPSVKSINPNLQWVNGVFDQVRLVIEAKRSELRETDALKWSQRELQLYGDDNYFDKATRAGLEDRDCLELLKKWFGF